MAATLLGSRLEHLLPRQLINHLNASSLEDSKVDYVVPPINDARISPSIKPKFKGRPEMARLPARINSPLMPYTPLLRQFILSGCRTDRNMFHGHHASQLELLEDTCSMLETLNLIPKCPIEFSMDAAKRFSRQKYSTRESLINTSAAAFAKRATKHDLSIAAMTAMPFETLPRTVSKYTAFVIMIQRLRIHIAKEKVFKEINKESMPWAPDEANYVMFDNGVYVYYCNNSEHTFFIIACSGHFRIYHKSLDYWFYGPITYLDYLFSIADITNNLDILRMCDEYKWAAATFDLMIEFTELEGQHNNQVNFMKGLEGFLLNMSDYDTTYAMNWKPILECTEDLWELDQRISGINYPYALILILMDGGNVYYDQKSFLCRFITEALKLSRTQRQEISALHKLIFYAEVDGQAGVFKFLKRVHTPRVVDENAVKNLTRYAKQLFVISYKDRHKALPNLIGNPVKVKLLESYSNERSNRSIELLPLSWWDDITVYDCMDNTLTTDPLEFAKDKGALKQDISHGPGDSRKELLQVIEKEDYTLKDFFKSRSISRLPQKIQWEHQLTSRRKTLDPARLIEKEKEQKVEARLFGNAELENKHALSVIAAKMKKALSYYDEQLMTPLDSKRKALIHDAARDLTYPDNYSLLLDIEGHNQSMQSVNCAELAEFIGNLFGQEGWGKLPDYFGQLDVFHYDEYEDKVITSAGQLGGIEGWLNPFWTLHTTLMMKLLRIMTDLSVKKIMVYSDDVDAILSIPQASEGMVQATFQKIMAHCAKFGMTVKYSQTMMSKHRITMLRQHYADGIRADSTLKRLIAMSTANNPMIACDELEVAGISSSASSALELSNHSEACSYLKNYKLGLLLSRLPQMALSNALESSMLSPIELPKKTSNILFHVREEQASLNILHDSNLYAGAVNDILAYLGRRKGEINDELLTQILKDTYGVSISEERYIDSPDRVLYLQIYDDFMKDLLFFLAYLPTSVGGMGASLHINIMLSGHSIGFTKALHYLYQWIINYACEKEYFLRYLSTVLSIQENHARNMTECRLASSNWPNDNTITPATTSVKQAIKNMVRVHTKNKEVIKLFELSDDTEQFGCSMVDIFRDNFHSRVTQFYYENGAVHFVDLLLNKVETSSGLLTQVRNLTRLRNSLCSRAVENIRKAARTDRTYYFILTSQDDIVEKLMLRKYAMFPKITFIDVEEVLYDDKIIETDRQRALITVRRCAPTHYRDGYKVYDDPKVGNETLYKGELIDADRMIGHKEELLAAKLVAVTKWFLTKDKSLVSRDSLPRDFDCVVACNLALRTITAQSFHDLVMHSPTETGGEILHRIPNMKFTTSTYIRSEMNRSLHYTTDLSQRLMTNMGLVDSNVNVDYLRMRLLLSAILRDKYSQTRRLVIRYGFSNLIGIKDVQYVTPKKTQAVITRKFKCYKDIRDHTLSELRFRYLAHAYLYEEDHNIWGAIPNLDRLKGFDLISESFVNDMIIRYAKDLDKEYMLLHRSLIMPETWQPLIEKLDKIDITWRNDPDPDPYVNIRMRLFKALEDRQKVRLSTGKGRLHMELQKQCFEKMIELSVEDTDFDLFIERYTQMHKTRRNSSSLSSRLAKYQQSLSNYIGHKRELMLRLVTEYILTFHFFTITRNGELNLDADKSVASFMETGLGAYAPILVAPQLQFQILLLGAEELNNFIYQYQERIHNHITTIADESAISDIDIPTKLPSLESLTSLTGDEDAPDHMSDVQYSLLKVEDDHMDDLHIMRGLCKFAHKCSIIGAHPTTFCSHTGSDSMIAQYGLFRELKRLGWISQTTRVCDLTAGRGDGLYAARYLDLKCDSYTRPDTFTRTRYHPDIIFKDDYDVFNGATLKFITSYDHIHVDISFIGTEEKNILDLILYIEELQLSYSIRLNSVALRDYIKRKDPLSPRYDHYICYGSHSTLKPYQIYLCGCESKSKNPGISGIIKGDMKSKRVEGHSFRDSLAFRSLTLAYSQLLSPRTYSQKLDHYEPNSLTVNFPTGRRLEEFILTVCDRSLKEEQLYYLKRYLAEVGEGAMIIYHSDHLDVAGRYLLESRQRLITDAPIDKYGHISENDIGNVSLKSRPFHLKHIQALSDPHEYAKAIDILNCDTDLLNHFRTRHPLSFVRTWCNIMLGIQQFCMSSAYTNYETLSALYQSLNLSQPIRETLHQREILLSMKLLITSAARNSYEYGVYYLRQLMLRSSQGNKSPERTLRIYKLSSFIFRFTQLMITSGRIQIGVLEAIRHDIEVREKKKYKYKRPPVDPSSDPTRELWSLEFSDKQIDNIFSSIEKYAQSLVEVAAGDTGGGDLASVLTAADLVFDIGIEQHIERAIQKLNLVPTGPHGIIDIGDGDIIEYDDW